MILHLGTKHKLIEKYVDVKALEDGDLENVPKLFDTDEGDGDQMDYTPPRKT